MQFIPFNKSKGDKTLTKYGLNQNKSSEYNEASIFFIENYSFDGVYCYSDNYHQLMRVSPKIFLR